MLSFLLCWGFLDQKTSWECMWRGFSCMAEHMDGYLDWWILRKC